MKKLNLRVKIDNKMKTQSKLGKFVRKHSTELVYGGALLTVLGFAIPKVLPSETITKISLENGKTATSLESTSMGISKNSLYVHDAKGYPEAFYTKIPGGVEYTDSSGNKIKITEKGYSVFNDTINEYEDFVPFEKDSAFYWKLKNYEDIVRQAEAKKIMQGKLEEGLK